MRQGDREGRYRSNKERDHSVDVGAQFIAPFLLRGRNELRPYAPFFLVAELFRRQGNKQLSLRVMYGV